MKHSILPYLAISLLAFSGLTAQAAQLASAKVLSVTGVAVKEAKDGSETPLKAGDILVEGDGVIVSGLSQAMLVFSNGSTSKWMKEPALALSNSNKLRSEETKATSNSRATRASLKLSSS